MKRSSTAKAVPTKRQAAGALAKLAKAHGKAPDAVRLDAAQALARAAAADGERLRQQLAATAQEAAADTAALAQQVTAARMWTRYERRKRQQAEQVAGRQLVQAMTAALAQTDEQPQRIRVRKPKARKPLTPLKHAGRVVWPSGKMGCKALLPVEVQKDGLAIIVRKDGKRVKLAFRESGRELLDKLLTAYGNADGWVQLPKEANGRRKKIANLLPPAAAALIQHETRNTCGGGHTGRVRLWVVDK